MASRIIATPVETAPVRPDEEMDWPKVAAYVSQHVDGARGPMQVRQFPGGSANLTYLIAFGEREFVLRRPPLGPVAPGAHDMAREHKVLSRLHRAFDRAPHCLHLCTDESVIGAKFIVVERRNGVVIRDRFPDAMLAHPRLAQRTSHALIDAMAQLHNVDPTAVELADLGRPDGFAQRQVDGWAARWELAKDKDVPLFYAIHQRLRARLPTPQRVSILHNDLKFDNCQFNPADPDRVTSIFDWDMATLGDPLFDLGTLRGYWSDDGDPAPRGARPTRRDRRVPHPRRDHAALCRRDRSRCARDPLVRSVCVVEDRGCRAADLHPLCARPDERSTVRAYRGARAYPVGCCGEAGILTSTEP